MKPSKKKTKDEKPPDAIPTGTTAGETPEENEEDELKQTQDEGETENLMEKGKKISLDDF